MHLYTTSKSLASSPDVFRAFGFGGGVNSWAAYILLINMKVRVDIALFADTGGEFEYVYEGIEIFNEYLRSKKYPEIQTVRKVSPRTGDRTLEENCLRVKTLPSRAFGMSSCAMKWKVEPQMKFLNNHPPAQACWKRGQKVVKILGYDGGEERRAKIQSDDKYNYYYPLIEFDLDRDACISLIKSEGLPVPGKSACFFCPSSKKHEVLALAKNRPDLFERAVHMERLALSNEEHPLRNVKGLGRQWSWEELVKMSQNELEQQAETPVESCTVCADGSED